MTESEITLRIVMFIFLIAATVILWFHGFARYEERRKQERHKEIVELIEKLRHDKEYGNTSTNECQRYFFLRDLLEII